MDRRSIGLLLVLALGTAWMTRFYTVQMAQDEIAFGGQKVTKTENIVMDRWTGEPRYEKRPGSGRQERQSSKVGTYVAGALALLFLLMVLLPSKRSDKPCAEAGGE